MASYSVTELLGWMQGTSQMREWDALFALSGHSVNQALQKDHALRLSQGISLNGITGSYEVPDTPLTHHLIGCSLSYPEISFPSTSYVSNAVGLSLQVSSGQEVITQKKIDQQLIQSVFLFSPLNAYKLVTDEQPVTFQEPAAGRDAQVVLDLTLAEELRLTSSPVLEEQVAGGKFFKAQFEALANERSVFPLARFPDQENPFLCIKSIDVGTQSSGEVAGEGALLFYQTMAMGRPGNKPNEYRYLIANDAEKDYASTALFSSRLINRAAFGGALLSMFGSNHFELMEDDGRVIGMKATSGELTITARDYKDNLYDFGCDTFGISLVQGAQPLTAEFELTRAVQHWQTRADVPLRYRLQGSTGGWTSFTVTFSFSLEQVFRMMVDEFAPYEVGAELFVPRTQTPDVTYISGLPDNTPQLLRDRIVAFIGHAVKTALIEQYAECLTATGTQGFLADVDLAGAHRLQSEVVALPQDYVDFGRVLSSSASFTIRAPKTLLLPGEIVSFEVEPAAPGVSFTVEAPSALDPGRMTPEGEYRAPPAHTLGAAPLQVLVIAHDEASDERSVVVVTVIRESLVVNPIIEVCNPQDRITFLAGSIGGGPLTWEIKNRVPGESGDLVPNPATGGYDYIAADEITGEATFVFDEINVTDEDSGNTWSSYVVAQHKNAMMAIKPDLESSAEGELQLRATINHNSIEPEWFLPFGGPGEIDSDTGLYREGGPSAQPCVVIGAKWVEPVLGLFEGYTIVPLPLADSGAVIRALSL